MKVLRRRFCQAFLMALLGQQGVAHAAGAEFTDPNLPVFLRMYPPSKCSFAIYRQDHRKVYLEEVLRSSLDYPCPPFLMVSELRGPEINGEVLTSDRYLVIICGSRVIVGDLEHVGLAIQDGQVQFMHAPSRPEIKPKVPLEEIRKRLADK